MTDHDFEHQVRASLREALDRELGPDPTWAESPAARRVAEVERRRRRRWPLRALAVAALIGAGGGAALLGGRLIPPPDESPAPSLIADATTNPSESAAPSASSIPVAGPGGVWIPTGAMVTPREGHSAVRLQDGRVLVVGGISGPSGYAQYLTSAEVYDPATGTWSAAGSISLPPVAATLLRDGKVLVLVADVGGGPPSAEVYDPARGTWTATGPMAPGAEKSDEQFTVLRDGRVLLAGGEGAQVYDPASGTWTATGPMAWDSQFNDTFTVLRDGRVLVAGGDHAQVYDPASGTWTATGNKNDQGYGAAAALLSDGKVLIAGGRGFELPNNYYDLDSAEVYDPVTGSWTAIANMHAKAMPIAAFLQPDGKVLVVGSTSAEVYDPATDTWTAQPVRPGTGYNTATLLSDGTVLVTGDADQPACTVGDLYDPHTGSWTTASTTLGCGPRSLTALLDGTVLAAGGGHCNDDGECGSTGSAELFVPAGVSLPPLPAFPSPSPFVLPSPTPVPTPFPPAAGPVPPNARSWTVTVDNLSSEPATVFVAEGEFELRLVGSATPSVVPAGASVEVTFLFPADGGAIYVNPRPGEGGPLVHAADIGIPGKIVVTTDGNAGWLSP
jgi:hypothetical protein